MGPICGYYKRHQKKPVAIMETICGYCNEWRMSTTICGPYAGIATNDECQQLFVAHMRVLQEMPKISAAIMGFRCGYCTECNMPVAILGRICGYCIFENLLMGFIIENDVGILYV